MANIKVSVSKNTKDVKVIANTKSVVASSKNQLNVKT